MDIGFTLTTTYKSVSSFQKLLDEIADRHKITVSHTDDDSELSICRLGNIKFDYYPEGEETSVTGYCQSNLLGAGFHKAAIEMVDELLKLGEISAEVADDTGYYEHRDFERMRSKAFYGMLYTLVDLCKEHKKSPDRRAFVCWDLNKYIPSDVEGTVVTPLGRMKLDYFGKRIKKIGIEKFANEFFMWNNEERDALFYRNAALSAMWEDCYFMPSIRSAEDRAINEFILSNLEKAAAMKPSLPFPKSDYLLLCRYSFKNPMNLSGLKDLKSEFPIGYRKDLVTHTLGNVRFQLPGRFMYYEEGDSCGYFDVPEDYGNLVRVSTRHLYRDEPDCLEDKDSRLLQEKFFEYGKCRLYALPKPQQDGRYMCQCRVLTGAQFTLFTICCEGKEGVRDFALDFFSRISEVEEEEDDMMDWLDEGVDEDEMNSQPLEYYEEEELDVLEEHICKYFGAGENVLHELVSPDIHVDIYIIEPTSEKNYYTLVTLGMGAHRMNVPKELAEYKLERAEVMICLPADWEIRNKEEEYYWPISMLQMAARVPLKEDSWIGWGHSVSNGKPFVGNTLFSDVLIINPEDVEGGAAVCRLPGGEEVNFYQMIPLYAEETDFKIKHGTEALLEKMKDVNAVVDIHRKNVCVEAE